MNAVGIVATIGPKTKSKDSVKKLLETGVTVFRLNGSHSDLEWHSEAIGIIREVSDSCPILMDIPGSKVRTGKLGRGLPLKIGQQVQFGLEGSSNPLIQTTLQEMPKDLKVGQRMFADDGTLEFEISEINTESFVCISLSTGTLGTAKGLNFPGSLISKASLSERDRKMLTFARDHGVDFVGISFVHSAKQIVLVRDFLGPKGPLVLAKIENQAGYDNRVEVISEADAIMIDRGDLAAETGKFEVGVRQASIVKECVKLSKPVIVATEVMHSMIQSPFPTKAEVSDVTTAVFQGASATMLSGETAVGDFPVETVSAMSEVIAATESSLNQERKVEDGDVADLMLDAAASIAISANVDKCVVFTRSGHAARRMSSRLMGIDILAVSDDMRTVRASGLLRGVRGYHSNVEFEKDSADFMRSQLLALREIGALSSGDRVLVTGLLFPNHGERQNFVLVTNIVD